MFALGGFERNTFAGIERRFEEAAGLTAQILASQGNTLQAEAGVSLNQQTPVGDSTVSFGLNGEASLVAPISTRIATKLSYTVRFDHLPEPGFRKTDRVFSAGLQITL